MTRSSPRAARVLLALAAAHGMAAAAVAPEAAQDLARKSGLWTQLESVGDQVRAGMAAGLARDPGRLPPAQQKTVLECAQSAYVADALRPTALAAVAGALRPADLAPLAAWYDSPLGRKVATIEATSPKTTPDPQERLRRGAEALQAADESRRASLEAIVAETHSVDMMADTLIEMALAVQQGLAGADPAASGPSAAALRADLNGRRPQAVAHYAQIALPAYAFTYEALADDELKQYADYLGTPPAMAFSDGTMRGVARALGAGSAQFGRCLKDAGAAKAP